MSADKKAIFASAWAMCAPPALRDIWEAEYYFSRVIVGDASHPPARPNLRERLAAIGLRDWRLDFAAPAQRVAVEVDGGQWQAHGGRHARDGDRWKALTAQSYGWRVLHVSPQMCEQEPARVVALVVRALEAR